MSTDQTHISVVTDEALTVGLKSWSRGQKSQAASAICSGGVSAVMDSSDLDAPTFGSRGAPGNQLSCSLPSGANRSIVEMACLRFVVSPPKAKDFSLASLLNEALAFCLARCGQWTQDCCCGAKHQ